MRKFLIAFLIFLGIVFILGRISEVESMVTTLQKGDIRFILLALVCLAIWFVSVAASYRAALRIVGIDVELMGIFPMVVASYFTNVITFGGIASGAALVIAEAKKRQFSTARAMVAYVIMLEFEYIGLLSTLAVGILVLIRRNNLSEAEITATVILMILATGFAFLLYLGTRPTNQLEQALVGLTRLVNKLVRPFTHKEYLAEKHAHEFAQDAADGLKEIRNNPRRIAWPLLLAWSNKALLLAVLFLIFLAFETPISVGTVIASYGIASLFVIVSPTPSGLGVVEGALALALISMYVKPGDATLITLSYRAITFWIPFFLGILAFRWMSRMPHKAEPSKNSDERLHLDA